MNFLSSIIQFNQTCIYNIDAASIKNHIKNVALKYNCHHNIDVAFEDQLLDTNKEYNYVKVIEYFYGNIIIELGILVCNYKESLNNGIKDAIVGDTRFHYQYTLTHTIYCNNRSFDNVIREINDKLVENLLTV
jgi:hypothetical protein